MESTNSLREVPPAQCFMFFKQMYLGSLALAASDMIVVIEVPKNLKF